MGIKSLIRFALWVLAVVAFVFAWIASFSAAGSFLGLPVAHLYWDALILGVLSLGINFWNCKESSGKDSE